MTNIIIKPIDFDEPGSYLKRRRILQAMDKLANASDSEKGGIAAISAYLELDDLIREHMKGTDDGTPLEEAIAMLTVNDFDQLLGGLLGGSPVPTESDAD